MASLNEKAIDFPAFALDFFVLGFFYFTDYSQVLAYSLSCTENQKISTGQISRNNHMYRILQSSSLQKRGRIKGKSLYFLSYKKGNHRNT